MVEWDAIYPGLDKQNHLYLAKWSIMGAFNEEMTKKLMNSNDSF